MLPSWRRKPREDETQKEITQRFFSSSRTRTQESRQSRAQNCQDVRHADLRVGKRQSRGEEAVKLVNGYLTTFSPHYS